jgi:hypothetical protein
VKHANILDKQIKRVNGRAEVGGQVHNRHARHCTKFWVCLGSRCHPMHLTVSPWSVQLAIHASNKELIHWFGKRQVLPCCWIPRIRRRLVAPDGRRGRRRICTHGIQVLESSQISALRERTRCNLRIIGCRLRPRQPFPLR